MGRVTMRQRVAGFFNPTPVREVEKTIMLPLVTNPQDSPKPRRIKRVGLSYAPGQSGLKGGRTYEAPTFNLNEVRQASEIDSFVRRALMRHIDLFMKEGYRFKGNSKAIKYLKKRFRYMAAMSSKPFDTFLEECVADFIKYHNVFLVKGRLDPGYNIPGMRLKGKTDKTAVSAYFKIPPSSVSIARTRAGNEIQMYLQTVLEPIPPITTFTPQTLLTNTLSEPTKMLIDPRNMVHMYKDREEGEVFGTPFILPVIPDVKTLREVEQYVVEMVYLFSNPVVVWKVGSQDKPGTKEEIADAESEAAKGPVSGIFVIPGDQDIEVKGATSGVDAEKYLRYFESRVFTGLGSSESQMGRGGTGSRATARTQGEDFFDRIRSYHRAFLAFFNEMICYELLAEGGFDPFDEDEVAYVVFNDPDPNVRVLIENQEIQKWTNDLVTRTEARNRMGYEPMTTKDADDTFWKLIKMPLAIIQAVDEPYTDAAKSAMSKAGAPTSLTKADPLKQAAVKARSTGGAGGSSRKRNRKKVATKSPASKSKTANQHGTGTKRTSPSREDQVGVGQQNPIQAICGMIRAMNGSFRDASEQELIDMVRNGDPALAETLAKIRKQQEDFVEKVRSVASNGFADYHMDALRLFTMMRTDVINSISRAVRENRNPVNISELAPFFQAFVDEAQKLAREWTYPLYLRGVREASDDIKTEPDQEKIAIRFDNMIEVYTSEWDTLTRALYKRLQEDVKETQSAIEQISAAQGAFDSMQYLVQAKSKTQHFHARNYGYGVVALAAGIHALSVTHYTDCPKCRIIDSVALDELGLHKLPPFHYHCECEVRV